MKSRPKRVRAELVVYGARDCCLCDDARQVLAPLEHELGLQVRYEQIDGIPQLEASYREQIPVGFLEGRKVFKYRVDEKLLRRHLAERR